MMVTGTRLEATQLVRRDRVLSMIFSVESKGFAKTLEMGYREDSVETPRYVHGVTKSWTRLSNEHRKTGDQSWVFVERTDVEAEAPVLWPPDAKS